MRDDGTALAEGFYWYAEKLMWGYEGTTKNAAIAVALCTGDTLALTSTVYEVALLSARTSGPTGDEAAQPIKSKSVG